MLLLYYISKKSFSLYITVRTAQVHNLMITALYYTANIDIRMILANLLKLL